MATYPVNQGGVGSKTRIAPDAGIQFVGMQTGSPRGYVDFDEETFVIEVTHPWLNATDRDAVLTFYSTNKTALNTIATNEGNFEGYFMNRPQVVDKDGPNYMLVSRLFCTAASP